MERGRIWYTKEPGTRKDLEYERSEKTWSAKDAKEPGARKTRKNLERERRERIWNTKSAKGVGEGPWDGRNDLERDRRGATWNANFAKERKRREGVGE